MLFRAVGSAPAPSSASTTPAVPFAAAMCSGVKPLSVRASKSAPNCEQRVTSDTGHGVVAVGEAVVGVVDLADLPVGQRDLDAIHVGVGGGGPGLFHGLQELDAGSRGIDCPGLDLGVEVVVKVVPHRPAGRIPRRRLGWFWATFGGGRTHRAAGILTEGPRLSQCTGGIPVGINERLARRYLTM